MPIAENTTVKDALEFVQRLYPDLHLDEDTNLITVNQNKASIDRVLMANDTISFLPFISGG